MCFVLTSSSLLLLLLLKSSSAILHLVDHHHDNLMPKREVSDRIPNVSTVVTIKTHSACPLCRMRCVSGISGLCAKTGRSAQDSDVGASGLVLNSLRVRKLLRTVGAAADHGELPLCSRIGSSSPILALDERIFPLNPFSSRLSPFPACSEPP